MDDRKKDSKENGVRSTWEMPNKVWHIVNALCHFTYGSQAGPY